MGLVCWFHSSLFLQFVKVFYDHSYLMLEITLADVFQAIEKGTDPHIPALHSHSRSRSARQLYVLVAIYLCHCLGGTLGGLAFPLSKAEDYITGVLFWLSKRALMSATLENPGSKAWSCLWGSLLPLAAPITQRLWGLQWRAVEDGPQCLPAHVFYHWNNSMAFKCL